MVTTSTTSATSGATSIVKTLGSGSGIDTVALVAGLVDASFAVRNKQLTAKSDALTAQISTLATLKSGITSFDSALKSLVKGGTLATQPTSSATNVLTVATTGTTKLAGLSGRITVDRLAAAQAATTNTAMARTAAFREGTLNVTIGGTTTGIAIGGADATLEGVAAKINGAGLGLTATLVTDTGGVRLTIKGASGAANAFTIDGVDADPAAAGLGLAGLSVGTGATGTTIGTAAADAELTLDGATFRRAKNSISDLVPGLRLELQATGATTLGATPPTANISSAVDAFVSDFNGLRSTLATSLDAKTGELKSDPAARTLLRALSTLTTTSLAANSAGAPRTLADLGVKTARDGSLSVDADALARALARYPEAVEAMFANGTGASGGGLSAALSAITTQATDRTSGFDAESTRYSDVRARVAKDQTAAADAATAMSTRLTSQFATMDARVAAYKSTQAFLKQQVDAWYAQN